MPHFICMLLLLVGHSLYQKGTPDFSDGKDRDYKNRDYSKLIDSYESVRLTYTWQLLAQLVDNPELNDSIDLLDSQKEPLLAVMSSLRTEIDKRHALVTELITRVKEGRVNEDESVKRMDRINRELEELAETHLNKAEEVLLQFQIIEIERSATRSALSRFADKYESGEIPLLICQQCGLSKEAFSKLVGKFPEIHLRYLEKRKELCNELRAELSSLNKATFKNLPAFLQGRIGSMPENSQELLLQHLDEPVTLEDVMFRIATVRNGIEQSRYRYITGLLDNRLENDGAEGFMLTEVQQFSFGLMRAELEQKFNDLGQRYRPDLSEAEKDALSSELRTEANAECAKFNLKVQGLLTVEQLNFAEQGFSRQVTNAYEAVTFKELGIFSKLISLCVVGNIPLTEDDLLPIFEARKQLLKLSKDFDDKLAKLRTSFKSDFVELLNNSEVFNCIEVRLRVPIEEAMRRHEIRFGAYK